MSTFAQSERIQILLHRLVRANAVVARCTNELCGLLRHDLPIPASRLANLAGSPHISQEEMSHPIADTAAMTVTWRGRSCALGNTVLFQLIERLARRPNQYISFDRLIREVWHGNIRSDETIRSSMRNLKSRLTAAGMGELGTAIRAQRRHYGLFL